MSKKAMRRYHHKVYFGENIGKMTSEFIEQLGQKEIGYTNHADKERKNDKRGIIPRATREILFNQTNTLVEIYEILNKDGVPTATIQKLVIRVHYLSDRYDYTYVIAREGFIVSNWAVDKDDHHRLIKSLDQYYCPSEIKSTVIKKLSTQSKIFETSRKKAVSNV